MDTLFKIDSSRLHALNIPFRLEFSHAMATRAGSDSMVLAVESSDNRGYGEAVVREYVSGSIGDETSLLEDAAGIVREILAPLAGRDTTWSDCAEYLRSLSPSYSELPMVCAVESALLDLACHECGKDIYQLLGCRPLKEEIIYGGTLPMLPRKAAEWILDQYLEIGISNIRIKIGTDRAYNENILRLAREKAGDDFDFRVDANASWTLEHARDNLLMLRDYGINLIEEPFGRNNNAIFDLLEDSAVRGFKFVADESVLAVGDVEEIASQGHFHVLNLRLAKNGGLLRLIEMAELAKDRGLFYQIGCHVGETGILSALGRVAASLLPDAIYNDGSYDRHLLSANITEEDFTFGPGGKAPVISGHGTAYSIDEEKLEELTVGKIKCL
ncbi:MAG TPA: hypothetical protein EYP57_07595 [Thermodesulfobacteriaceae bacterium]|nr:hypothetical protein [Thermodesulfobacteriaceae bacterium]